MVLAVIGNFMQIVVLDPSYKLIEELHGDFTNNTFSYKEGGFHIPIPIIDITIGATIKNIPIDYNLAIDIGNERKAYVMYDGVDYKQLKFTGMNTPNADVSLEHIVDIIERAELSEDASLEKPQDRAQLINTILLILTIVAVGIGYWGMTTVINNWHQTLAPFNQTLATVQINQKVILNQSAQLYKLYTACYNKTVL